MFAIYWYEEWVFGPAAALWIAAAAVTLSIVLRWDRARSSWEDRERFDFDFDFDFDLDLSFETVLLPAVVP